jgi:hypothetical protein
MPDPVDECSDLEKRRTKAREITQALIDHAPRLEAAEQAETNSRLASQEKAIQEKAV